jgi:proteasome assembly chaperone (PAC2) family protein
MTKAVWPEVYVRHSKVEGRDLLVLTGMEPDLAWRKFSSSVAELAQKLGVVQLITLGSVPGPVPHTLSPPILTTASDKDLLAGDERPPDGLLRVPAAAVSIVDRYVADSGIPSIGFFVQVPHYVTGTYPSGVLALVRRIGAHLGIEISSGDLEERSSDHRRQLDEIVAGRPEALEHVRALEAMHEEQKIVSGEELASEIERYLRDASPGDRNPFEEGEG